MRKLGLFKKIFTKNLKSGKTPLSHLAQDVGSLHGLVTVKGFDVRTEKLICNEVCSNIVVNKSKSSVIRLLGQGESIYEGVIDPTDFKITKMRFSNDTGLGTRGIASPNKLEYYDISEASHRISYSSEYGSVKFGGGKKGEDTCSPPVDPPQTEYEHEFANSYDNAAGATGYQAGDGVKIFDLRSGVRPPSHASVVIKIYKDFNDTYGSQLIEQINIASNDDPQEVIYNRSAFSNYPIEVINFRIASQGDKFFHVTTPLADDVTHTDPDFTTEYRLTPIESTGANITNTRIFYDYTSGQTGWKFALEETDVEDTDIDGWSNYSSAETKVAAGDNPSSSNNIWDSITIEYNIGQYNVVNLIIPKTGYNYGRGYTELLRYNNSNGDSYNTVTPVYEDCADDFIDDYAVTFTTSMSASQGNGFGGDLVSEFIKYTKAFLFCNNDDMFSSIVFPMETFLKNSTTSFQISWKILAPVE